jgi:hypothetical protein
MHACYTFVGKGISSKAILIGKLVTRYDKNSSQNAQNYLRENPAKVSSRKSAKSFLAKKSAKLRELMQSSSRRPRMQDMEKMCKKTRIANCNLKQGEKKFSSSRIHRSLPGVKPA